MQQNENETRDRGTFFTVGIGGVKERGDAAARYRYIYIGKHGIASINIHRTNH